MNEQKFRAVVEAAVRRVAEGDGEGTSSARFAVDEITSAADDYSDGHMQGMIDEREVHFG